MRAPPRLQFLAETVAAEARHLRATDARLFAEPMTSERSATLRHDIDLSERADAFVARFGRLQDTLGDKLLPELLQWLAEPVGAAIDNLNRAERLGWIDSVEQWLTVRRLRNRMIHEYVRDDVELAAALSAAHAAVPLLDAAAAAMIRRVDLH
jgi:uncharacterized protein with HEPN domain